MVLISYIPLVETIRPEPDVIEVIKSNNQSGYKLAFRESFGRSYSILYYTQMDARVFADYDELIKLLRFNREKYYIVMYSKEYEKYNDKIDAHAALIKKEGDLILLQVNPETIN
jgi:hypothetical protein